MLTVLFDTNIFHQEGLTSTRIQRFQRLLKESEVKLIIPEIVLEEFRSRRLFLADQEFNNIKKSVNNLQKKEILKNTNIFSGCFYSDSVENIHKQSIDNISKDIDFWIANDNIEIYKISNTCIDELFKNYFSGNGAFREKKKREDIPDAVIYDAIEKISEEQDLYVIAKDVGIQEAINSLKNVKSLSSLEDFLSIEIVKKKISEMDEKDSRISRINDYLKSSSCQIYLEEYYEENGISELECLFYKDRIKLSYDFDDVTIFEPELVAINPSGFNDFYLHNPNYLGDNKFSISFQFESEVDFKFSCTEDDFEELPYKVRKLFSISRPNEAKIVHAKGKLDAQYRGVITISNVNEELTVKELDVHFSYLGADQCSILCYLDIELVEVKEI